MIKFIESTDLLPVRNIVLREGKLTNDECRFPTDEIDGAFHLGYYSDIKGTGYQLRGMATLANYRGKGFGKVIVDYAIELLKQKGANYIWCNARKVAAKFYSDCGFEIISEEFEIKGIGPHYVMCRILNR
jgi:GNAT superfamily N-acetyltransferase